MTSELFDRQMMQIALGVGRRGLGATAPNPAVGAVIADEATGEVIARGWTQPGGRPHAETEAIRRAGPRARGATLYVTLEPCAHHGKTPPCADAIVAAGLRRVVVGVTDPDERTAGKGIRHLAKNAIDVVTGVCAEEARWLTLGHILRISEQRPFVTLKMAVSGNGEVPRGAGGSPVWVTGPEARAHGHLLRAEADAIIAGEGTIVDDDPELTCRLSGLSDRSPVRVVLSTGLEVPLGAKIVVTARQQPTWIVAGATADTGRRAALERRGVRVLAVPRADRGLSVARVLHILAEEGITRVLVEGGPRVWRSFGESGLVDEVVLFGAPDIDRPEAVAGKLVPGLRLRAVSHARVGVNGMYRLRTV